MNSSARASRWNFEAEYLSSGKVEDEIELGRLLDRKVARLGTAQNFVNVFGRAPENKITRSCALSFVVALAMMGDFDGQALRNAAIVPRHPARRSLGAGKRHGVVAVCASGKGS